MKPASMSYTVKDLIAALRDLPPDAQVIMQKDGEGNSYSPLAGVDGDAVYVPQTTWMGDVYSTSWTADDAAMDQDEWADILKQPRCVVLAPTN
jgi:hypothetical protein